MRELAEADALLLGRRTYEEFAGFWPQAGAEPMADRMNTIPKLVASSTLDRADWHVSGDLRVPANLTLIHLPSYSPELNPVERVWLYLRERWLSHRVLTGSYDTVLDATCTAWNALLAEPGRLCSLTACSWLPPSVANS